MKKRNSSNKETFHGKDAIIRLGTVENPLCGTRGLALSRTKDTVDITTRDDAENGYTRHAGSWKTWTIATDGLFVAPATSLEELENAYETSEPVPVTIEIPDKEGNPVVTYSGEVIVTSFDIDSAYDDVISFTSDLQGTGNLKTSRASATGISGGSSELFKGLEKITEGEVE